MCLRKVGWNKSPLQHYRRRLFSSRQARGLPLREELRALFKIRTLDEWNALLGGADACYAPILSFWEARTHPHNVARESFIEVGGTGQPAPTPKFSRTAPEVRHGPIEKDADRDAILKELGL